MATPRQKSKDIRKGRSAPGGSEGQTSACSANLSVTAVRYRHGKRKSAIHAMLLYARRETARRRQRHDGRHAAFCAAIFCCHARAAGTRYNDNGCAPQERAASRRYDDLSPPNARSAAFEAPRLRLLLPSAARSVCHTLAGEKVVCLPLLLRHARYRRERRQASSCAAAATAAGEMMPFAAATPFTRHTATEMAHNARVRTRAARRARAPSSAPVGGTRAGKGIKAAETTHARARV